jgi:putative transposase
VFVLEFKVKPKPIQTQAIEEAIRTSQFVRNKVLRYWMDNRGIGSLARVRYARRHLRVSRQREEFAKRIALRLIQSTDLVAYKDLNVFGMVKNRHLAKSISDAAWSTFRRWLEYFGYKYGKVTVAVSPHNTSQNCSNCGQKVQKSLSTRTHICPSCGYVEDRDINAAINILRLGLSTVGQTESQAWGESTSTLIGAIPSGQVGSVNQESSPECGRWSVNDI